MSIRWHLQHYLREPQPSAELLEAIESRYREFTNDWAVNPDLWDGRSNIINLNLVLAQLILECGGQAMYDAHLPDFPQTARKKWISLFKVYMRFLALRRRLAWCPVRRVPLKSH